MFVILLALMGFLVTLPLAIVNPVTRDVQYVQLFQPIVQPAQLLVPVNLT